MIQSPVWESSHPWERCRFLTGHRKHLLEEGVVVAGQYLVVNFLNIWWWYIPDISNYLSKNKNSICGCELTAFSIPPWSTHLDLDEPIHSPVVTPWILNQPIFLTSWVIFSVPNSKDSMICATVVPFDEIWIIVYYPIRYKRILWDHAYGQDSSTPDL